MAFSDEQEVWWLETIGGHHWIASRVPDGSYAVIPNQLGLDEFDLEDALGEQKEHICSSDLKEFMEEYHLNRSFEGEFSARDAFGSRDDADHIYNTPRAWAAFRYFNPRTFRWEGERADFGPEADDLPWCMEPERKVTVEDVKYVLSNHFQGTPFDPYGKGGDASRRGMYRPIGVNRTDVLSVIEIRPYAPEELRAVQWTAFGSNVFNGMVPQYTNVHATPEYLSNTTETVTTENFYWASRLIGTLADAHFDVCANEIERYQNAMQEKARELIFRFDREFSQGNGGAEEDAAQGETVGSKTAECATAFCERANHEIVEEAKRLTDQALGKVLYEGSCHMKNAFARSDA